MVFGRIATVGVVGLAAALVASAQVSAAAERAPGWSADHRVGNGVVEQSPGKDPNVAINPSGAAVATWQHVESGEAGPPKGTFAMVATRDAGAGWSTPSRLPTSGPESYARVGIDRSGRALAIWFDRTKGSSLGTYYWAQHKAHGTWSKPVALSSASLTFDMTANGHAAIAARGSDGALYVRLFNGSRWGAPIRAGQPTPAGTGVRGVLYTPQLSARADGVTLAWQYRSAVQDRRQCSTLQRVSVAWSGRVTPRTDLTKVCDASKYGPYFALAGTTSATTNGTAFSWVNPVNVAGRSFATVTYRGGDAVWHRHALSSAGGVTTAVAVAVSGSTTTATWAVSASGHIRIYIASGVAGTWGATRTLADYVPDGPTGISGVEQLRLARGASGYVALWREIVGPGNHETVSGNALQIRVGSAGREYTERLLDNVDPALGTTGARTVFFRDDITDVASGGVGVLRVR